MIYKKVNEVVEKIQEAIKELEGYDVDEFINQNYQQYLVQGEHSDNTLDTSYYFNMLKEIEGDKDFMQKMKFVLKHFTSGAMT